MKKRIPALLLAVCLSLSLCLPALADGGFSDVEPDSWYYDSVTRMADMKALNGYADGSFRPDGSITNGEFITVLMKTLTGTDGYPAESGSHWASGALNAAYAGGVCTDEELTAAELDTPITRARAALYTHNAVRYILREEAADSKGMEALIMDMDAVNASGCGQAILDMYARGIITGDDKGNFNPGAAIRRSEAAVIVLRAYDSSIRRLPFGIQAGLESVYADRGVIFLDCVGEKYDVKSLNVTRVTANGVQLDMKCLNSESTWTKLIGQSSAARRAYAGATRPDAVVTFDWDAEDIESLAENYASADGRTLPVTDMVFTMDITLTDGTVLPFTYKAGFCVSEYGGVL
ncbi:MAG: S-layer homology domain-containing protein [Candidatus Heteroscillospira sp.]|jgi:hypothetical protein